MAVSSSAFAESDGVPYPAPEKGYRRVDIVIPYEEKALQDLISVDVGVESKRCDAVSLLASSEKKTVEGWGFDYLVIRSNGDMMSDLMPCQELTESKFVPANLKIFDSPKDYPARAPYTKVIYVPNDLKVRVKYLKEIKSKDL
jgi:ecotin